jgi:sigma-E factor negative regulatory protein RseA
VAWAEPESEARRSWHAYQLIGDVLRSEDLASPPGRDQAFLARLHARLAEEPALPVPHAARAQAAVRHAGRTAWALPAALAAGVMALATVLVVSLGTSGGAGPSPALAVAPAATEVAGNTQPAPPVLQAMPQGARIVRDAQLDRYLQAHRDYGTALPGSLPGGPGRSLATVAFER